MANSYLHSCMHVRVKASRPGAPCLENVHMPCTCRSLPKQLDVRISKTKLTARISKGIRTCNKLNLIKVPMLRAAYLWGWSGGWTCTSHYYVTSQAFRVGLCSRVYYNPPEKDIIPRCSTQFNRSLPLRLFPTTPGIQDSNSGPRNLRVHTLFVFKVAR